MTTAVARSRTVPDSVSSSTGTGSTTIPSRLSGRPRTDPDPEQCEPGSDGSCNKRPPGPPDHHWTDKRIDALDTARRPASFVESCRIVAASEQDCLIVGRWVYRRRQEAG